MKINNILILAFVLLAMSCAKDETNGDSSLQWLSDLEANLVENPSDEKVADYLSVIDSLVQSDIENAEVNAVLLSRASAFQFNLNKLSSAINLLSRAVKDYPDASNYKENLENLSELMSKMNQDDALRAFSDALISSSFDEAGKKKEEVSLDTFIDQINSTQRSIYSTSNNIDLKMARRYVRMVELLAFTRPEADAVPGLLYDAGKVAEVMKDSPKSVYLFEWCNQSYPNADIAANNLFMLAFTCQDGINDSKRAATYYKAFMDRYPEHELFSSAEFLLENIGKSDEEILNDLRK